MASLMLVALSGHWGCLRRSADGYDTSRVGPAPAAQQECATQVALYRDSMDDMDGGAGV
ncbi:MAG: hypothetical protein GIW96_02140 [Candidatus Eremiobacteraeota bacterium]|nr:hypothetical protein [Candidatus Eremiobacteraeota bacterium]